MPVPVYVAVSQTPSSPVVMTSDDGITWTAQTAPAGTWTAVAYGAGVFAALTADNTTQGIMTSPDGIAWTLQNTPNTQNAYLGLQFLGGQFLAGIGANGVMTSPDGITWTAHATPLTTPNQIAYGNGVYVAITANGVGTGDQIMTSADGGATWTAQSSPTDDSGGFAVTFGNGIFVALALAADHSTEIAMTSVDGMNWVQRALPPFVPNVPPNIFFGLIYAGGQFVAVGYWGVMTSSDGINWTVQTAANASYWYGIAYAGGQYVAVGLDNGSGSPIMTSPDGVNWTEQAQPVGSGAGNVWNGIASSSGPIPPVPDPCLYTHTGTLILYQDNPPAGPFDFNPGQVGVSTQGPILNDNWEQNLPEDIFIIGGSGSGQPNEYPVPPAMTLNPGDQFEVTFTTNPPLTAPQGPFGLSLGVVVYDNTACFTPIGGNQGPAGTTNPPNAATGDGTFIFTVPALDCFSNPETTAYICMIGYTGYNIPFGDPGAYAPQHYTVTIRKLTGPCAVPPPPTPPVGSGAGSGPPPYPLRAEGPPFLRAGSCALPSNCWDALTEREARALRHIQFPRACTIPEQYGNLLPWDEDFGAIPEQSKVIRQTQGIVTPAPAAGDQVMIEYHVPTGFFGLLSGFFFQYSGIGFVQGSGDLIFRIRLNQRYLKDLSNVLFTLGNTKFPIPMTQGQPLLSDQRVQAIVNVPNLSGLIQVGQSTCYAGLFGFLWPYG